MKPRKIKARRMWGIDKSVHGDNFSIALCGDGLRKTKPESNLEYKAIPVAVLDVSDEDALVEQVAQFDLDDVGKALANDGILGLLKKTPIDHAREYARALLESLGIISKRRKKL